MRRSDKAVTQVEVIAAIFAAGTVCQLAFSDQPVPYLVSLNYAYHQGALYFHSANEGRKIELMQSTQTVAFTVVRNLGLIKGQSGCTWTTRFQSVVGSGALTLFDNLDDKRRGLEIFMTHYSDEVFSFPDHMIEKTAVFRLDIDEMTVKQSRVTD